MPKKKSPNSVRIRNSTAEFLTFAYQTGGDGVEVRVQDGTIWLSQKNMGELFMTSSDNVGLHLKNIFKEGELSAESVTEESSVTAADGKNYLTAAELEDLGRIVSAYLDLAESRAKRRIPMTMQDWARRLDIFLSADDRQVLQNAGRISAAVAQQHAEGEFEKYRVIQDRLFQSHFDTFVALENRVEDETNE